MKIKKAFGVLLSALSFALVALEIILILFVVVSKIGGQTPSVFGYQAFQIISPSMEPEIMVGDMIISRVYHGGELAAGDVVTYIGREGDLRAKRVTHKVIAVEGDKVITQGVANPGPDPQITKNDIIGVMVYKTVILDNIYRVISSTAGFILLLVLPLVAMILGEVRDLVKLIRKEAQSTDEEE